MQICSFFQNLKSFAINTNTTSCKHLTIVFLLGATTALFAQTTTDPTDPDYIVMGGNGGSGSSNDGGDDGGGTSGKAFWSATPAHTASVLLQERLVARGVALNHAISPVDTFLFGDDYVIQTVADLRHGYLVMGTFRNHLVIDGQTLQSRGQEDIFIARFDDNTNVIWLHQIGGAGSDWGVDLIATSGDGWTFGGQFSQAVQVGPHSLESMGSADIMLVHVSVDGQLDWAQGVGGTGEDRLDHIQVNPEGMLLHGSFIQAIRFTGPMTLNNQHKQGFQALFSRKGQLQWYALNQP